MIAPSSQLRDAIGRVLGEPLELVRARAHGLQSSCPLDELWLRDATGRRSRWLLKDVSARSQRGRPTFLYDERREIAAYRLLAAAGLASPRLRGVVDGEHGHRWMLMEHVDGVPLWQSDHCGDWASAAEWVADLHELRPAPSGAPWLRYDAAYFAPWMERARAFAPEARLDALAQSHAFAAARLAEAPAVTVHGDYYPSNVLVRSRPRPRAGVCPLDFELTGSGPAALDLAALTTGLTAGLAATVVDAYRSRLAGAPPGEELDELLACARLHLAIRWLGWIADWRPPEHQSFDWAAEAHAAAAALEDRLGVGAAA